MLTRSNIICCILTILLVGYLVVALITTSAMQATATAPRSNPVEIIIAGSDSTGFVTRQEVAELVKDYFTVEKGLITTSRVPGYDIEECLNRVDNIESATCTRRSNDRVWIEVTPMKPVARVFDDQGSYYINREGKRLVASTSYRCDVPVITGNLGGLHSAARLMPLVDYINADKALSELITDINLEKDGTVTLIPAIRGHVVEFGEPNVEIENKFERLITMYSDILPVKGWDFYSRLSVKFKGQVVGTRRKPRQHDPLLVLDPEGDASDNEDLSTMTIGDGTLASAPINNTEKDIQ